MASLLVAAIIGSWCNFFTVLYIGKFSCHNMDCLCSYRLCIYSEFFSRFYIKNIYIFLRSHIKIQKVLILNMLVILIVSGFVAAHVLPVLYERYDDQVDGFVYNALEKFQCHYQKLDHRVLSRFPTSKFRLKKFE